MEKRISYLTQNGDGIAITALTVGDADMASMAINTYHERGRKTAALTAALDQAVEALEQSRAAIWDRHYGNGLSVEYANNIDAQISTALEAAKKARQP